MSLLCFSKPYYSAGKLNQRFLCQTTFELAGQIVAECVGNSNGNLNRRSIFPLKSLRVHLSLAQCTFFLNSPFEYQSMLISAACPLCKREYHFHKEINKNFPQPQSQNQLQSHHKKWQNESLHVVKQSNLVSINVNSLKTKKNSVC